MNGHTLTIDSYNTSVGALNGSGSIVVNGYALHAAGVAATLWLIPGATHDAAIWSSTGVLAHVDSFLDRTLKAHGRGRPSGPR